MEAEVTAAETPSGLRLQLRERLASFPSLLVAYSGGVDSAFLLHEAASVPGLRLLGVIADSPSLPRAELAEALALAAARGWPVERVETREMENPAYVANPLDRCYHCKFELFTRMEALASERGFSHLAYGENADDAADFRPGRRAAERFEVVAPLRDAGLSKAEIRALSAAAGLPTASKAAQPCLSSRLPTGRPVTREALAQIEAGEGLLRGAGLRIVRLRHLGETARIELGPDDHPRLDAALRERLRGEIAALGFDRVEIDPRPYRGAALL